MEDREKRGGWGARRREREKEVHVIWAISIHKGYAIKLGAYTPLWRKIGGGGG